MITIAASIMGIPSLKKMDVAASNLGIWSNITDLSRVMPPEPNLGASNTAFSNTRASKSCGIDG